MSKLKSISTDKAVTLAIKKDLVAFRLSLYMLGIDIGFKRMYELEKEGYINASNRVAKGFPLRTGYDTVPEYVAEHDLNAKSFIDRANEHLAKVKNNTPKNGYAIDLQTYTEEDMLAEIEMMKKSSAQEKKIKKEFIYKKDWTLEDTLCDYDSDFFNFINSINAGFSNIVKYDRFEKYKKQAAYFLMNPVIKIDEAKSEYDFLDQLSRERKRCLDNSLYALNAYLKLAETNEKGFINYNAWEAQAVVLFLFDCMISFMAGKLRQIGFTSTLGGAGIIRTMLRKSYHTKFVAQKGDKSDSIFEQKVKFPLEKMDWFMKPDVSSYTGERVLFGKAGGKAEDKGSYSSFSVEAPTADVINSGTPALVLLDEIGLMKNVGEIISQGRPTMFKTDPISGIMKMVRQLIAWGTGGNMKDGASGMKQEWKAAKEAWLDRDFRHGIVPIFINAEAKPGFTRQFYESEMSYYYRKAKAPGEKEDPKVIFHYTYPMTEDDMFLESSKTILPLDEINKREEYAKKMFAKYGVRGFFEPIFDYSAPAGEYSDVQYKIIGARFVPASNQEIESSSPTACVHMIEDYSDEYVNDYYKGTDPINTQYGISKFASGVWSRNRKSIVCVMSHREPNFKFMYLQSLLMNIYYGGQQDMEELVEINIGQDYVDYCREKGFGKKFVTNEMLPEQLQLNSSNDGISKKPSNSHYILYFLEEMFFTFKEKIFIPILWSQLKTFVEKTTTSGISKYAPANKEHDNDDALDCANYAYICAKIHDRRPLMKRLDYEASKKTKTFYTRDANFNLVKSNSYARRVSIRR